MSAANEVTTRAASAAKRRSLELVGSARNRSRQFADSAQHYVKENPWRVLSYSSPLALGLGVLIGRLLAPDHSDMANSAEETTDRLQDLPENLGGTSPDWLGAAKEKSQELVDAAQARSREIFRSTRDYAQENPWRTASYATAAIAGVAAVAGFVLFMSRRRYDSHR